MQWTGDRRRHLQCLYRCVPSDDERCSTRRARRPARVRVAVSAARRTRLCALPALHRARARRPRNSRRKRSSAPGIGWRVFAATARSRTWLHRLTVNVVLDQQRAQRPWFRRLSRIDDAAEVAAQRTTRPIVSQRRPARSRIGHPQTSARRAHGVRAARRRRLAARRNRRAHRHRGRHQQGASAPRTAALEGVAFAMNERDDAIPKLDALIDRLPRAIDPPRDLWPAVDARIALPRAALAAVGTRASRQRSRRSRSARCSSAFRTTRSRACRDRSGLISSSTRLIGRCARRRSSAIAAAPIASIRSCAKPSRRISRSSSSALARDPLGAGEPPQRRGVGADAATDLRTGTRDRRRGDSANGRAGSITLSRCIVKALNRLDC